MKHLDKNTLPCKFGKHWDEYLGEKWMGTCPMFECTNETDLVGDWLENNQCNEASDCPGFQPVETEVCRKHDREFYGCCPDCENESEYRREQLEKQYTEEHGN